MASQVESHRAGAEIVSGDGVSRKKSIELLEELGLPKGLLPLEDIEEFGYNKETGFMWLVQRKKKIEHTFKKIKQTVTAFVEKGKLKKITGVKTKELLLWLSVVEVYVADASPEKVTFKTGTGLSDTFDATAFALGERTPRVRVHLLLSHPNPRSGDGERAASSRMASAPELIDDIAAEILLRIPPDEPAHLVHASLVCKPWRRILTDPAFLRRYRAFHRTPPVLGFLHNVDGNKAISSVPRFVPTTAASPFSPPAIDPPNWWWALDCRHGRVLSHLFNPMELMVWDPITGDQHRFPLPPHPHAYCTGAVLCAASDCHHLDCHQGPFLVVFVGTGRHDHSWACVYSSETGEWSSQASIVLDSYVEMLPSVLAENTLYFYCEYGTKILGYDIGKHELSEIDPPLGHDGGILIESEYGGLGFATVEACGLVLWSQYVCYDGIEEWEQSRIIELDMLIPNFFYSGGLVGFAEGTDIIFMLTDVDLFAIELKSGQVKKVGESRPYYAVIPYMSFYTSDLARKRLAQPAGMHGSKKKEGGIIPPDAVTCGRYFEAKKCNKKK
uniref:F-box domain-containing protein n=1 Tax=Oryza meridionalis TaxID=40149 RepID=A0A0E0E715_9ORYZ